MLEATVENQMRGADCGVRQAKWRTSERSEKLR